MDAVKELLACWFKPLAQVLYNVVVAVPPAAVKTIFIVFILSIALWVFTLKKESIDPDTGKKLSITEDLRYWAITILVIQASMYMLLG